MIEVETAYTIAAAGDWTLPAIREALQVFAGNVAAMAMTPERLDAALAAGGADTSRGVFSIDVIEITAADYLRAGLLETVLVAMVATALALAMRKTLPALASAGVVVAALALV